MSRTLIPFFALLWTYSRQSLTLAATPQWDLSNDDEWDFFFSDDESEERVLQAMALMEGSNPYDTEETHDRIPNEPIQSVAPIQRPETVPPETDRSAITTNVPPSTKEVSSATSSLEEKSPKLIKNRGLHAITTPWVRQFLARAHKDVLLPVPKDYCSDNFNLANLQQIVEKHVGKGHYKEAIQLLTETDPIPSHLSEIVDRAATILYVYLHQRYICSPRGIDMVRRRFLLSRPHSDDVDPIFGRCPMIHCDGMPLLPVGDSDHWSGTADARRYCPRCRNVFYHWESSVDGCVWGTSFCHLFLMVCGDEVFGEQWRRPARFPDPLIPQVFGFKLHPSAYQ